jgi:hypothetical protein
MVVSYASSPAAEVFFASEPPDRISNRFHRRFGHVLPPDRIRRHPQEWTEPRPRRKICGLHAEQTIPGRHAA